jgi:hypothetical protein
LTDEQFQRVEELFRKASELDPKHRAEFLNRACQGDSALRAEIEGLLLQESDPHDLLKTLALVTCPPRTDPGRMLGSCGFWI